MIKCIVCDLDETLLNEDKEISQENINIIKQVGAEGVKFVFATGRGYASIQNYLKALDLNKAGEYAITTNGAIITDNKDNEILCCHSLNSDVAESIIKYGLANNLCVQVFLAKDVYGFNCSEEEKQVLLGFNKDAIIVEGMDYSFLKDQMIVKVMYQYQDYAYLHTLEDKLDDGIKGNTTISYSSNRYMEFNLKGISKAKGVSSLCEFLNITLDEVLAIGDNLNDYSMLELVPNSACVANAVEAVKKVCKYVSPYTNNEHAIVDIIKHFIDN